MRRLVVSYLVGGWALALAAAGHAASVSGDYVEARSADVWTGPCFANGEMGLLGQEAILAWRVSQGEWNGVPLAGLSVVGVVKASATLGDPFASPLPVRSVLIVDERATPSQRKALLDLAREMGGELFADVVHIASAPIRMETLGDDLDERRTVLEAGALARIETRTVGERDRHCGNESTYYPPLAPTTQAVAAVSVVDGYAGPGLGVTWTTHDKRSAFVASFAR
jgi:hypothetical protein